MSERKAVIIRRCVEVQVEHHDSLMKDLIVKLLGLAPVKKIVVDILKTAAIIDHDFTGRLILNFVSGGLRSSEKTSVNPV